MGQSRCPIAHAHFSAFRAPAWRFRMSEFDNREEGFEKRFAVDEELAFKALARRNKLIGLWLAGELGLAAAEAKPYAEALVDAQVGHSGAGSVCTGAPAPLAQTRR